LFFYIGVVPGNIWKKKYQVIVMSRYGPNAGSAGRNRYAQNAMYATGRNIGTDVYLKPLMRLIVSSANSRVNYQHLINKLNNVNRNTLNANTQKNYNTIRKGINAIKAELKKNNDAAKQRQNAILLRGKARRNQRRATTVQAYARGFLERSRINKARFVPVTGPNGITSIAVRNNPASGFRRIAAKEQAKKLKEKRMFERFANNN
jgi:hypothetical protein